MRLSAVFAPVAAFFFSAVALAAPAAVPSACTLFNASMASSLAGMPVGKTIDDGYACTFTFKMGIVTFGYEQQTDAKSFRNIWSIETSPLDKLETVSDFGEPSYLINKGAVDHQILAVLHHQKNVSLSVLVMNKKMTPELRAQMIQTMKQALAKF